MFTSIASLPLRNVFACILVREPIEFAAGAGSQRIHPKNRVHAGFRCEHWPNLLWSMKAAVVSCLRYFSLIIFLLWFCDCDFVIDWLTFIVIKNRSTTAKNSARNPLIFVLCKIFTLRDAFVRTFSVHLLFCEPDMKWIIKAIWVSFI